MVEGGFASARDGSVEVDSNTGSAEELQQELASEVAVVESDGRRSSKPAEATLTVDDEGAAAPEERREAAPAAKGKRQSIQARIDAITGEKYATARERDAAVRERDELRTQLEALKAGGVAPAAKAAPVEQPAAAAAPAAKVEKFPKYAEWLQAGNDGELEDWVDARDAWKDARAAEASKAESARQEHSRQFTQTAATFNERMAPVLEADPEFYERIDPRLTETPAMSALPPGVKPHLGHFIVEQVVRSKYPKELMEYLSDKKVIQRIVTLQPGDIIREITAYELTLGGAAAHASGPAAQATDDDDEDESSAPAAAATLTSRAHPPAKPVRGSSHEHSSPDEEPGEDASDDDWYRWEQKRVAKQARA